ncbi:MAG TPA: ATP-binding protein [Ramlibacter sp.]|nr:ATP-binding protein [Ramlibacter sp.]
MAESIWLTQAQAQRLDKANSFPTQAVALPHEWDDSFPEFGGVVAYRMTFEAPADERLLAVRVPRACSNLDVYVNGQLIGSGGRMTPPYTRNCYRSHLFALPRTLLKAHANVLEVHVAGYPSGQSTARQRAPGLSAVEVGPVEQLRDAHEQQRFWNVTVAQIVATTLTGLGLAMLGLWAARRTERYVLYFGLFLLSWAALTTRFFVQETGLPHATTEALTCAAFVPTVSLAMVFLVRLIGRRWRWMDAALALQCIAAPVLLLAWPPGRLIQLAIALYVLLTVQFVACATAFSVLSWRTHRKEFWLLGVVLLQSVVTMTLELLQQHDILPLPSIHLIHFTMPVVFALVGFRLLRQFIQALRRADALNGQLEARVQEKSSEIADSWRQIAQLRAAQAAQAERHRIASDLHDDLGAQLLTIVHASAQGGDADRVARMARTALDEMRLSVRGLTGHSESADDTLADWRAETVTRLNDAGLQACWEAQAPPPDLILPSRTQVQLTRVLREAISNVIQHSGARRCTVRIAFDDASLRLEVEDDGSGPFAAGDRIPRGHGLAGIERRVRNLAGVHSFGAAAHGGALLWVRVPVSSPSVTAAPQGAPIVPTDPR